MTTAYTARGWKIHVLSPGLDGYGERLTACGSRVTQVLTTKPWTRVPEDRRCLRCVGKLKARRAATDYRTAPYAVRRLLAEMNHAAMVAGKVSPPHGKRSTYINYRCDCDACVKANSDYQRTAKARREARTS